MKAWHNPYVKRFGEKPLTIVKDLNEAIKVELIQKPEITGALREFVECGPMSSAPDYRDSGGSLKDLLQSNALWQGLETLHFTFRVTGCSRMLTHQLVRHRVGITFSQQCSDSVDWRHQNIVLPNAMSLAPIPYLLNMKLMYASQVDSLTVSCQEARYLLPQCLETFIYIHVSLATLIPMIKKRICTMSQPWETVLWAIKTRDAVIEEYPELLQALWNDCDSGKCFYHKSKEQPRSAYLYQPDLSHDFEHMKWNSDSYVYGMTHQEMACQREPHETRYYEELNELTKKEYYSLSQRVNLCQ